MTKIQEWKKAVEKIEEQQTRIKAREEVLREIAKDDYIEFRRLEGEDELLNELYDELVKMQHAVFGFAHGDTISVVSMIKLGIQLAEEVKEAVLEELKVGGEVKG